MIKATKERKDGLIERLATYGIKDYKISYLPYLDVDETQFATPYEAGSRMMICYAIAYSSFELEIRPKIAEWLIEEGLWPQVSEKEKQFLEEKECDEKTVIDFSWQSECAYILAWALNIIKDTPVPTEQVSEEGLEHFAELVPSLGDDLKDFLTNLSFRDYSEIYDENLFHELATTYFRDLLFNGKEDTSSIDRDVSFLRHQTLNWLRRFMQISDWDHTDTST